MNMEELNDEIERLADLSDITPEDDAKLAELLDERDALKAAEQAAAEERAAAEAREARIAEVRAAREAARPSFSAPNVIRKPDALDVASDRNASPQQLADAVTRSLEDRVEGSGNQEHVRRLLKRHRTDTDWSRGLLIRSTDAYESAWAKAITGRMWELSPEERTALSTVTSANGDYLVPTHLDPTVILSNDGSSNAIRGISRVVTLTRPGDTSWQGITSAGVSASFDAQLAEVSDDSPT